MNSITKSQEREYRQWVRDSYEVESPIDPLWHPVIQDECRQMNYEARQTEILDFIND